MKINYNSLTEYKGPVTEAKVAKDNAVAAYQNAVEAAGMAVERLIVSNPGKRFFRTDLAKLVGVPPDTLSLYLCNRRNGICESTRYVKKRYVELDEDGNLIPGTERMFGQKRVILQAYR